MAKAVHAPKQSLKSTNGKSGPAARSAAKPEGETVSGYFRRIFKERPELLDASSNQDLLERWLKDHPGTKEVPKNVRGNMMNLKSVLRKKRRQRAGRRKKAEQPSSASAAVARPANPALESLEEHIDESLTLARNLDREGLQDVITILRHARNQVVWKIGM